LNGSFDFRAALADTLATLEAMQDDAPLGARISELGDAIADAIVAGHRVFFFGNGGSAADAQHIAAELVGRFRADRPALPAEALTVNSSVLTAVANDFGFEQIFARQLEALGRPGDVAVGISTSGSSPNVMLALARARQLGLVTALLTGAGTNHSADHVDLSLIIPCSETPRIQEGHIVIGHILCDLVEQRYLSRVEEHP
jgi:D-sedoheptulose 7-phosphate isomerase